MAAAVGGLLLVRRVLRPTNVSEDNAVAGFLYPVVGAIYGVLLSFIVFVVWQGFADTSAAVTTEAADLVQVYRDTETFPEPLRQEAQAAVREYIDTLYLTRALLG